MSGHDPGCPCGHPLHRDVNTLEPLTPETRPDLGSLATPKRQEVLAPDIRPASELASGTAAPRSTAGPGVGGRSEPPVPKDDRSEANIRTRRKRRQRARAKAARERQIAQLEFDLRRVLRAAASAMERCEVADDPSGAADEASDILAQVVTLSGELVCEHYGCRRPRPDPPCKQVDTTPGGTWVYKCGHLIGK